MQRRLEVFGRYAAPIYQEIAQRHDFQVLIQHSSALPERWLARLSDLATQFPVLVPVAVPGWVEARETVHEHLRGSRGGPVVMLRIDDDDLISTDFLDLMAPHVTEGHHGWCISLGAGLAAHLGPDGIVDLRHVHTPLIAIGQAFVGRYRRRGHHLDLSPLLSHRQVPRTLPTVVDSRSAAFVHLRHEEQDSWLGSGSRHAEQRVRDSLAKLQPIHGEEVEALTAKFPTLAEPLSRWAVAAS